MILSPGASASMRTATGPAWPWAVTRKASAAFAKATLTLVPRRTPSVKLVAAGAAGS